MLSLAALLTMILFAFGSVDTSSVDHGANAPSGANPRTDGGTQNSASAAPDEANGGNTRALPDAGPDKSTAEPDDASTRGAAPPWATDAQEGTSARVERPASLSSGDQCVLSANGTAVFLSIDENTNERLTRLCTAGDQAGVAELVALGRVAVIKPGTRAKIISRGFLTSEVRILEGDHASESGIVDSEFLRGGTKSVTAAPVGGAARTSPIEPQLRITQIAGKTPGEVKAVLGMPTEVTPITNYPDDMPGEYRDYTSGRLRVTVQFFRGIAIGAAVDIDEPPARSPVEALGYVGLSPNELSQTFETPKDAPIKLRVIRWRGTVDGVEIEDVSATKSGNDGWVLVAVHFPRSLAAASNASRKGESEMARYTVYFSNGSQKQVSEYHEDGGDYVISFATGGRGRYPKKMVKRFEPVGNEAAGVTRTWTDKTGKHKVEAALVAVEDGNVTLRKADDKTITIPLEKLSEADQELAKQYAPPATDRN
jgi:hypothetical protein